MSVILFDEPKVLARIAVAGVRTLITSSSGKAELAALLNALTLLSCANARTFQLRYDETCTSISREQIEAEVQGIYLHENGKMLAKSAAQDLSSLLYNTEIQGTEEWQSVALVQHAVMAKLASYL